VDISNQSKVPNITISANASNYFNQIAYPIAGAACQYFRLQKDYTVTLFKAIQSIEIFLITVHRLSESSYSRDDKKF